MGKKTGGKGGSNQLRSGTYKVANGRYIVGRRIGAGSFGEIYEGTDTLQPQHKVAIKLEKKNSSHAQLIGESRFYTHLHNGLKNVMGVSAAEGGAGHQHHTTTNNNNSNNNNSITSNAPVGNSFSSSLQMLPEFYFYGTEGDYNILVMELLGPSLEDYFTLCGERLSLKTTLMLADQMMSQIQFVHSRHLLHRDIKPDNFIMGAPGNREGMPFGEVQRYPVNTKSHQLYIIDFGLAKKYRDPRTHTHIPYKEGKSLTGTARYCSINTHLGIEQSRRDDMEGIGYILLYFLRGNLPWQGLKAGPKEDKYARIAHVKITTPVETLCEGLPIEFAAYVNYTRCIPFEDAPDYGYCRTLFKTVFANMGFQYDLVYDWDIKRIYEEEVNRRRLSEEQYLRKKLEENKKTGAGNNSNNSLQNHAGSTTNPNGMNGSTKEGPSKGAAGSSDKRQKKK